MATAADRATPSKSGLAQGFRQFRHALRGFTPKGLYARSLIIIIAPMVILQAVVGLVLMDRYWQGVSRHLAVTLVGDIAAVIDLLNTPGADFSQVSRLASDDLGLRIAMLPPAKLPTTGRPLFTSVDKELAHQIIHRIRRPFTVDTVGTTGLIDIRVELDNGVLRVLARRNQAYAPNSLTYIAWMLLASIVLLTGAILFLRGQIRPILTLAAAVDDFGKGRPVPDFPARGAREVRRATTAFHEMRQRVERQIDQRTAMLAGVSHDLRTVLTRLRLQLALIEETADVAAMKNDVDDMSRMLEGYLAFARGDPDEDAVATDVAALIAEVAQESRVSGHHAEVSFSGDPVVKLRPQSFKRCLANLVANAARHGARITVAGSHADGHLTITVDDDGPGVPAEEREAVFKPFYRLDNARNLDESGTGLGLTIARDIARHHGGDIGLSASPLGGLRAAVSVPA